MAAKKKGAKKKGAKKKGAGKKGAGRKGAKKSSAKKKGAGKKGASRKAAKKKGAKKTGKTPPPIVLDSTHVAPCKPHKSHGDVVTWKNTSNTNRTVTFDPGRWPFEGFQEPIPVPAKDSASRTVRADAPRDQFDYSVTPKLECKKKAAKAVKAASGPPDGPAVIIDD
ncbi:MAG TPA: hypothetical protein VFK69_01625 [Candidatus Eisenbacteria bacterium]|nr:hypothetical protein [Candidatus Eisenbacteria bacterium]